MRVKIIFLMLCGCFQVNAQLHVAEGQAVAVTGMGVNGLNVLGDVDNNGTIDLLVLTGGFAQSITGIGTVKNLTVDKSSGTATISFGGQSLTGVLTLAAGTLEVGGETTPTYTPGLLTLKSSSTLTARVAEHCTGTGTVTGNVVVEKYINVQDRPKQWRTLGFPYDADMPLSAVGGMKIDYNAATRSVMQFNEGSADGSYGGGSTARNTGYTSFENEFQTLPKGKGVMAWIFGHDGVSLPANGSGNMSGSVTVISFGPLFETGEAVTMPVYYAAGDNRGWNLLSNPFASAIDWNSGTITKTGLNDAIYRWNPASASWTSWTGGGTGIPEGVTSVIESGGSFFVKATAAPTLTIPQSAKVTDATTSNLHFSAVPQRELRSRVVPSAVRLAGVRVSVKGQGNPMPDEAYVDVSRSDATSDFDPAIDGLSMGRSSGAGIAVKDAKANFYSIQFDAPIVEASLEKRYYPLKVTSPSPGQTTMELWTSGAWNPLNSVSLIDSKEGKTILMQGGRLTYPFNMSSLKEEDRFILAINHVAVDKDGVAPGRQLRLLGNPVTSEKIDLLLAHPTAKPRHWELSSMQGAKVAEGSFQVMEGNVQYGLNAPGMRASGVYVLRVELDNGEVETVRVMRK